jgi:hypothetical protein
LLPERRQQWRFALEEGFFWGTDLIGALHRLRIGIKRQQRGNGFGGVIGLLAERRQQWRFALEAGFFVVLKPEKLGSDGGNLADASTKQFD